MEGFESEADPRVVIGIGDPHKILKMIHDDHFHLVLIDLASEKGSKLITLKGELHQETKFRSNPSPEQFGHG